MAFLFGGARKVAADPVREHLLEVKRAIRAMDRERDRAAAADRLLGKEIVACAREQRLDQCKAKAKELVRTRAHRGRLEGLRTHLLSLGQQLEAVRGTQQVHRVLEQTTTLMRALNQKISPKAGHRLLAEFGRQSTAFSMGQEVMQEALDDAFEADDEQEASDDALSGIFMELGLTAAAGLRDVPEACAQLDDEAMQARLAQLRAQPGQRT